MIESYFVLVSLFKYISVDKHGVVVSYLSTYLTKSTTIISSNIVFVVVFLFSFSFFNRSYLQWGN